MIYNRRRRQAVRRRDEASIKFSIHFNQTEAVTFKNERFIFYRVTGAQQLDKINDLSRKKIGAKLFENGLMKALNILLKSVKANAIIFLFRD